ncbi:DoxX-like family protein [Flagellimonas taeanensis]|uniref:DoxX-like family protein n=1 Tax=Flagellimonas taeanensis TaxID=1005926 RepID=A0A1M7C2C7_9FLAO|nr:DoxX family protein [Allomuricauda taeanensis]SFC51697.1 DoxX-like family protein [Allomuricauda taeanensis]SHL61442.1 DoxX-like family protein [Allomuricauda taeanensis]
MKTKQIVFVLLRIVPAIILLQTLYFKFSAAPESVFIFETLGLEPYGRIGLGVVELITAMLLLVPRTTWIGALLGMGIMAGALFSHITTLGVVVQDDGGTLFIMALITFLCCLALAWTQRDQIPLFKR